MLVLDRRSIGNSCRRAWAAVARRGSSRHGSAILHWRRCLLTGLIEQRLELIFGNASRADTKFLRMNMSDHDVIASCARIAVIGGVLYLAGLYGLALILIVLAIISGAGAVLMALVNPDWYRDKRSQAGLETDFFNARKGIGSLIFTKAVTIAVLIWIARHFAEKAGYL